MSIHAPELMTQQAWQRVLQRLCKRVNASSYNTWLRPCQARQCDAQAVVLAVPDDTYIYWLNEHYLGLISDACASEFGQPPRAIRIEMAA